MIKTKLKYLSSLGLASLLAGVLTACSYATYDNRYEYSDNGRSSDNNSVIEGPTGKQGQDGKNAGVLMITGLQVVDSNEGVVEASFGGDVSELSEQLQESYFVLKQLGLTRLAFKAAAGYRLAADSLLLPLDTPMAASNFDIPSGAEFSWQVDGNLSCLPGHGHTEYLLNHYISSLTRHSLLPGNGELLTVAATADSCLEDNRRALQRVLDEQLGSGVAMVVADKMVTNFISYGGYYHTLNSELTIKLNKAQSHLQEAFVSIDIRDILNSQAYLAAIYENILDHDGQIAALPLLVPAALLHGESGAVNGTTTLYLANLTDFPPVYDQSIAQTITLKPDSVRISSAVHCLNDGHLEVDDQFEFVLIANEPNSADLQNVIEAVSINGDLFKFEQLQQLTSTEWLVSARMRQASIGETVLHIPAGTVRDNLGFLNSNILTVPLVDYAVPHLLTNSTDSTLTVTLLPGADRFISGMPNAKLVAGDVISFSFSAEVRLSAFDRQQLAEALHCQELECEAAGCHCTLLDDVPFVDEEWRPIQLPQTITSDNPNCPDDASDTLVPIAAGEWLFLTKNALQFSGDIDVEIIFDKKQEHYGKQLVKGDHLLLSSTFFADHDSASIVATKEWLKQLLDQEAEISYSSPTYEVVLTTDIDYIVDNPLQLFGTANPSLCDQYGVCWNSVQSLFLPENAFSPHVAEMPSAEIIENQLSYSGTLSENSLIKLHTVSQVSHYSALQLDKLAANLARELHPYDVLTPESVPVFSCTADSVDDHLLNCQLTSHDLIPLDHDFVLAIDSSLFCPDTVLCYDEPLPLSLTARYQPLSIIVNSSNSGDGLLSYGDTVIFDYHDLVVDEETMKASIYSALNDVYNTRDYQFYEIAASFTLLKSMNGQLIYQYAGLDPLDISAPLSLSIYLRRADNDQNYYIQTPVLYENVLQAELLFKFVPGTNIRHQAYFRTESYLDGVWLLDVDNLPLPLTAGKQRLELSF